MTPMTKHKAPYAHFKQITLTYTHMPMNYNYLLGSARRVPLPLVPMPCLYRVRHIKCYRAIALKLLIRSKNVSDKSFSDREGRHTGPPSFFYRWRRWSYVKVNSTFLNRTMYFFRWHYYPFWNEFSDLQHEVILVTQSIKIVEKSKNIGIITFKGSTNLGLGLIHRGFSFAQ